MRQMRENDDLAALVDESGEVTVDGHFMGTLKGFQFEPDSEARGAESRALMNAANRTLTSEIKRRVKHIVSARDDEFTLDIESGPEPRLTWKGEVVGTLVAGKDALHPRVSLMRTALLEGNFRQSALTRLEDWIKTQIRTSLGPLLRLAEAIDSAPRPTAKSKSLGGPARGLGFTLCQALGNLPRSEAVAAIKPLTQADRAGLRRFGVTFGETSIYIPVLLKPSAARLKVILAAIHRGAREIPPLPKPGAIAVDITGGTDKWFYEASGYRVIGQRAIRIDMLERLATTLRKANETGPFAESSELTSIVGGAPGFAAVVTSLGYTPTTTKTGVWYSRLARRPARQRRHRPKPAPRPKHSPFAALAELRSQSTR
jgi:ATP-dependent RNA helicase SUPV3L1/SUV3